MGESVCIFDSKLGSGTGFFTPLFAKNKVITESNGVASFDLMETFDLDIINSQTTFYFGVFKGEHV